MGKPSKDYAVPLWEKANLTVYEAAAYSGIGADMRGWIRFVMRRLEQQKSLRSRNYLSGYISAMAAICTR